MIRFKFPTFPSPSLTPLVPYHGPRCLHGHHTQRTIKLQICCLNSQGDDLHIYPFIIQDYSRKINRSGVQTSSSAALDFCPHCSRVGPTAPDIEGSFPPPILCPVLTQRGLLSFSLEGVSQYQRPLRTACGDWTERVIKEIRNKGDFNFKSQLCISYLDMELTKAGRCQSFFLPLCSLEAPQHCRFYSTKQSDGRVCGSIR